MPNSNIQLPLIPVILSGGSGTRLWPLSRKAYPKQFIPLVDHLSLFQATVRRLQALDAVRPPIVVCNAEHRFMVAEQLRQLEVDGARVLLEPVGRNTAPAIGAAAFEICEEYSDGLLLVLPADHLIRRIDSFHLAVREALPAAAEGKLVTFGIVPEHAETGYGYIRQGSFASMAGSACRPVAAFVEKPSAVKAAEYLASGDYLWNSGMFLFAARRYLEALEEHAPKIHAACAEAHRERTRDLDFIRLDEKAFASSPNDSIDYAVMEKTRDAVVVPLDAGWSDVGSWQSLWQTGKSDAQGNVLAGDVLSEDCKRCYINAQHRLVAAVGLEDHVIIETADAVLVAPRGRAQEVRVIVDRLAEGGREETVLHRKVYRPWGAYEGIDRADRFQVKRITVNPGQSLSLQMHHHRAEHWIIVKGTARITRDDEVFLLSENESTYIPIGARHRLENPGMIPLEMIEVQSGSYLGEDDITRFEDIYGR